MNALHPIDPKKRILLIVFKNTMTLDVILPVLYKIRQLSPEAPINLLFTTWDINELLGKDAKYYRKLLTGLGLSFRSFRGFLPWHARVMMAGWQIGVSAFCPYRWESRALWVRAIHKALRPICRLSRRMLLRLQSQVDVDREVRALGTDLVLFDNRAGKLGRYVSIPGVSQLYAYLTRTKPPVFLLPHAPHHSQSFVPFDIDQEPIPDYCQYWIPHPNEEPWRFVPDKKERFRYVGYPGLDKDWLDSIGGLLGTSNDAKTENSPDHLRCMFIIRGILEPGQSLDEAPTPYYYTHDEFVHYLREIKEAFEQLCPRTVLVLKLHPRNDEETIRQVCRSLGNWDWEIGKGSIYEVSLDCDFVISLYSTAFLVPTLMGLPLIFVNNHVMDHVLADPEYVRDLYIGLRYFIEDISDLRGVLPEVVTEARKVRDGVSDGNCDINHIRKYYPNGSIDRCLNAMYSDVTP